MRRALAVVPNDYAQEEETRPGRRRLWSVRYDGVTVDVPMHNEEGRVTLRWLWQQYREDGGHEFELRDPTGKLVASSGKVRDYLTSDNMSIFLDDPFRKK